MAREILFRGKRTDNGEWAEGELIHAVPSGIPGIRIPSRTALLIYSVIPETVGQFTGLTDRNGKKIFEGDVVRFEDIDGEMVVCVVLWGENAGRWELDVPATGNRFAMSFFDVVVEVVGNLCDNPELLNATES